ncbi:helix-turn-helix domain-containing protein [Streptomyces sp. NBC_00385]|uniref:helix-turn-helix domain-containing protein n=1 Tax=Streptomyces sp. NBC_00385 TaxID=2975733 RepID=UPI002DDAF143|nr:helix-turn-helix domain-containing protein [Streptomyces sp. NBC_00385]WRZ04380.1 helix-turn-helix domain-containing protein [Streptomyces sp. NBC_00385]
MTQSTAGTSSSPPLPSPKERRRLREAKSLSEAQVAAAVGVTRATVRAWETGRTSPRGRKREVYARLIGTGGTRSTSRPSPVKPATPNNPPRAAASRTRPAESAPAGSGAAGAPDAVGAAEPSATPLTDPLPPTPVEAIGSDAMDPTEPGTTAAAAAAAPAQAPPAPAEAARTADTVEAGAADGADADGSDGSDAVESAEATEAAGLSPAEAFDSLYRHTAAALYRQTYLLTGRRALSREAVGKAFEQAWQRWPEVAVDRDPVGWVRAAAYEYAMSPWHRLRREHRHPDPPPEAPGPRALLDALLALPPSYRRTLLLHDGVGLGLPETAAETEASTPAAAGRLVNARAAVAEQLPELAEPPTPAEQSALLHEHLGALALAQPASSLPVPDLIRTGSERKAQLWTRAAIAFTVLLIGLTLITLATAPTRYETPESPPQRVEGVPPLGGPQKLTPQDKKLQKKLGGELVRGPGRLVPRAG